MNKEYDDFYYLGMNNSMTPLHLSEQTGYIKLLKKKLKEHNYFKGEINGQFDMDVRNAIMELQNDYGLALTGIVDDKVLEVLLNPSHISLSKEEYTSDDVIILEMKLKRVEAPYMGKAPTLRPKEFTEKKMLEMLIPQKGIETLYPPFIYEENIYIVKPGDTLWGISKRFHTTVEEIMAINNLQNTLLSIGQQLIIPNAQREIATYMVRKGDTLWSIAKRFGTTVNEIKRLNNLPSDFLKIGQELVVVM